MRYFSIYIWLVRRIPVAAIYFIGLFYSLTVLINLTKDTTGIINVAVAVTASLAGLCFAMSASVSFQDIKKDRINYAGERFFHAAIFLVTASVLKYSALSIRNYELLEGREVLAVLLTTPINFLVVPLFFYAVFNGHSGVRVMNDILWERMHNIKDWDKLT